MALVEPWWLLRVSRAHARDRRVRTGSVFAQGTKTVPAVHRSQVTRWERGEISVTYSVVRRYEQLCGLEEGRLLNAIDLAHRYDHPGVSVPLLARPVPADPAAEIEALLDRALGHDPLTGAEWDHLTALLGTTPDAFLKREDWQALVRRGLQEMAVATRLHYRLRTESMSRIAGHPRASRHVVDLIAGILGDPTAQVYSEAASMLLQCRDHPAVCDALIGVIGSPVNVHALRAALFTAATVVRARRTSHEAAVRLVELALELARDRDQPYRVRRSAADVLLALRPATRRAIAIELRRRPEDLSVASIIAGDGPRPLQQVRALRKAVLERVEDQLGASLQDEPPLLKLLDLISTESNDERRTSALHMLMLLPFGEPVGRAYLEELGCSVRRGDALAVHESLGVLLCLAPGDDLPLLTDLAVRAVDIPDQDQVAVEACWALGNAKDIPHGTDDASARVVAAVREALAGARPAGPQLFEAWAYVLGMHGHRAPLEQLTVPPGAPATHPWEHARQWWLSVPAHLLGRESRGPATPAAG